MRHSSRWVGKYFNGLLVLTPVRTFSRLEFKIRESFRGKDLLAGAESISQSLTLNRRPALFWLEALANIVLAG